MNPDLALTRPYPFTRLKKLLEGSQPPAGKKHISLSIGEPKRSEEHTSELQSQR